MNEEKQTAAGQFMKVKDVANLLGVSESWVRNHVAPKKPKKPIIPHTRIGAVVRFEKAALEEFLAKYGVRDEAA